MDIHERMEVLNQKIEAVREWFLDELQALSESRAKYLAERPGLSEARYKEMETRYKKAYWQLLGEHYGAMRPFVDEHRRLQVQLQEIERRQRASA